MKNHLKNLSFAIMAMLVAGCTERAPEIVWREGMPSQDGNPVNTLVIRNTQMLEGDWTIWFAQMKPVKQVLEGSNVRISHYNGPIHRIIPDSASLQHGDSIVIRYVDNPLRRRSWAPEGFVLQTADGRMVKLETEYEYQPLKCDGDAMYAWNKAIRLEPLSPVDIIPQPKNRICEGERPDGWYRITMGATPIVEANDEDGRFYAQQTLSQLTPSDFEEGHIIEDWPDYQYRGFMLDVSRMFTTKENLFSLIDLLARYKVNVLHLHLSDDEGWRLEVTDIPELTQISAYHSFKKGEEYLPSYDFCISSDDTSSLANGYYSREDFIEILRYAWERRIRVLPEVDMPGHSLAAIHAMKAYEQRTGDSSMRLQDPADSSVYMSAQGYNNNVMSVELESVYNFAGHIIDYIINLYKEADVPLIAFDMGGDEVPKGAWNGKQLHPRFLGRIAAMAKKKNVALAGWQEVAMCKDKDSDAALREVVAATHVWNTRRDTLLPYKIADRDFPVVLSNVHYTYADQAYNAHMCERAQNWACFIDDVKAYKFPIKEHPNVIGVQAQIWTETVRSFDDICYDILPKSMGVFERAWNRVPEKSVGHFYNKIIQREMPMWEEMGLNYHVPQPGLIITDGHVQTNHAIPGAHVSVSKVNDHYEATATYGSHQSCTTISQQTPIPVIFDTDMGNDVDDAIALAMLHRYADQGRVEILGIPTTNYSEHTLEYLGILNAWYGHPDIPLGSAIPEHGISKDMFVGAVCTGHPLMKRSNPEVLQSVDLYRKLLSQSMDHSVVIISVGYNTNLSALLESAPDDYSRLDGYNLVKKKVKMVVTMMGNFQKAEPEWNVVGDLPASLKFISQWPSDIVITPFELGNAARFPGERMERLLPLCHPVALAYAAFKKMPYDRPSWDITAVQYAVEGPGMFGVSPKGRVSMNEQGVTTFETCHGGRHVVLSATPEQARSLVEHQASFFPNVEQE